MSNNEETKLPNLLGTLGICRKAGKLVTGFDAVVKEMSDQKTKLSGLLIASDLSEKTAKEVRFHADKHGKPVTVIMTMDEIETVLGKRTGVIAVLDDGLYKSLTGENNLHLNRKHRQNITGVFDGNK